MIAYFIRVKFYFTLHMIGSSIKPYIPFEQDMLIASISTYKFKFKHTVINSC